MAVVITDEAIQYRMEEIMYNTTYGRDYKPGCELLRALAIRELKANRKHSIPLKPSKNEVKHFLEECFKRWPYIRKSAKWLYNPEDKLYKKYLADAKKELVKRRAAMQNFAIRDNKF